jgi:hypothetical protein
MVSTQNTTRPDRFEGLGSLTTVVSQSLETPFTKLNLAMSIVYSLFERLATILVSCQWCFVHGSNLGIVYRK